MCLGIPMQVIEVEGFLARCVAEGVERDVNVMLLGEDVQPGSHVLVHLGHAVRALSPEEFEDAWSVLKDMSDAEEILSG